MSMPYNKIQFKAITRLHPANNSVTNPYTCVTPTDEKSIVSHYFFANVHEA